MNENTRCFKTLAFIGIDPGISKNETGAAALIYNGGYEYFDFNTEKRSAENIRHWSAKYNVMMVAIERQWARLTDSHATQIHSISKLLINYGLWKGICLCYFHENMILYPTPQQWQKSVCFVPKDKDAKQIYLEEARKEFPNAKLKFKKNSGRAAALWLSKYAYHHYKVYKHGSRIV